MLEISNQNALNFRLRRQYLSKPGPKSKLGDAIGELCGIQSQLYSAAQLSIGVRLKGISPEVIDKALWKDRTLVKSWMMRQTVHLLPAEDYPLFVGAIGSISDGLVNWAVKNGIERKELEKLIDSTINILSEDALTRKQIVERLTGSIGNEQVNYLLHSWGGIMKIPVMRGQVLFGPPDGQETTFVKTEYWIGKIEPVPEAKARERLLRRFLKAYGPAQLRDFGYWSMLKVGEAKEVYERMRDEVTEVSVEGTKSLILNHDTKSLTSSSPKGRVVNLIPNFDLYLLGHKDKSQYLNKTHYKKVFRQAGWLSSVVLIDGKIEGLWSYERTPAPSNRLKEKPLKVIVEPFGKFKVSEKRLISDEAEKIAAFWGYGKADIKFK